MNRGLTIELESIGLFEWTQYLYSNGGWGWPLNDDIRSLRETPETTALEAVKNKKGKCTERSKILYAVLHHAGVPAEFVYVNPVRSKADIIRKMRAQDPTMHHVCIGIPTSKGMRLLDPSIMNSNAAHREYYPFSPREFWALELSNRSGRDTGEALNYFNAALALDPDSPLPLWNRAMQYALNEKTKEAWMDIYRASAIYPLLEYGFVKAHAHSKGGMHYKALETLDRMILIFPKWSLLYKTKAIMYTEKESYESAEREYTQLINLEPNNADHYFERGCVRYSNGDTAKAVEDLTVAVQKNPKLVSAYSRRADAYIKLMEPEKARADVDAMIALGHKSSELYSFRARSWLLESKWSEALRDCNEAIQLSGKNSEALRLRAFAYVGLQRIAEARRDLVRYCELMVSVCIDSAVLDDIKKVLIHVWNTPEKKIQNDAFDEGTGRSIAEFQLKFFMAGVLWELGKQADAIDLIDRYIQPFDFKDFQSAPVQSVTQKVFAELPDGMRKNKQMMDLLNKFGNKI